MGLRKTTQTALHSEERRIEARDYTQLVNQLGSIDARERRWAARDLQAFDNSAPVLLAALESETDIDVSEAIFTSLQKLPSPTTISGLLALLDSESAFTTLKPCCFTPIRISASLHWIFCSSLHTAARRNGFITCWPTKPTLTFWQLR